ncbi:hypothetical protein [Gimesia fumaroli]|uniref:Uncharacterized protein n=1 Tax=Gimesia fumaroli TaxID=2527976 RepID=A0A518ICR5_9PLAN|nr:hypothetical protein [Gimesia fumaroli]QDV50829.1 hypothetical protein Enr17x_28740 [Gimesia fumaroli]
MGIHERLSRKIDDFLDNQAKEKTQVDPDIKRKQDEMKTAKNWASDYEHITSTFDEEVNGIISALRLIKKDSKVKYGRGYNPIHEGYTATTYDDCMHARFDYVATRGKYGGGGGKAHLEISFEIGQKRTLTRKNIVVLGLSWRLSYKPELLWGLFHDPSTKEFSIENHVPPAAINWLEERAEKAASELSSNGYIW